MNEALDFLTRFTASGHVRLWAGAIVVGICLELLFGAEKGQPLRLKALNMLHGVVYALVIFVCAPLVYGPISNAARALGGARIELPFFKSDDLLIQVLGTLLYFAIIDFFYYWMHRAQHAWPVLWDQHAVHHSETALNVTTTVRQHWSEFAIQAVVISLPVLLLVDLTPTNHAVLATVFGVWQFFLHANLRLQLGPLGLLMGGPQIHRIHHSIEPKHRDRNFAAYFPMWDVLFGTYWHPKRDEFPATGIDGERQDDIISLSFSPFLKWGKRLLAPLTRRAQRASD